MNGLYLLLVTVIFVIAFVFIVGLTFAFVRPFTTFIIAKQYLAKCQLKLKP